MKMIWHIMKKDFRAVWPQWLAWMGLIAIKIFLLCYFLNYAGAAAFSQLPMITGCGMLADVILIAGLVKSLVHEDGPVGDNVAWITRPISGWKLVVAKLLSALLICVASPLVLLIPTWLVFGCDGTDLARVLVYHGLVNGSVLVAAFAFAVITKQGNSFWLVVVASVIAVALIATGVAESDRFRSIHNKVLWPTIFSGLGVLVLGFVWQYLKRSVRVTRVVFSVLVLAVGVLLPSLSGESLFREKDSYKSDMSANASWLEAKLISNSKGRKYVEGRIEVVTPSQDLTPRLRYIDGSWVNIHGQTERALFVNNQAHEEDARSIWPVKITTSLGQYRYKFPVSISAPKFDDENSAGQVGFKGRLAISYWRTTKLAETALAAGESVSMSSFFARVISVKTFENAIEIKTVEAGVGGAFSSTTIELANDQPSDWRNRDWYGGNFGMLLWISIRSHQSTVVPFKEMYNPNWSLKDRGAPTQENLREKHWRIFWKHQIPVGGSVCELKAERLEITKE